MCYAYKDNSSEELLVDHLVNVLDFCQSRWEFKALSRKISRVLGLSEDDVENAIATASVLHDIGKAAQVFQDECAKGVCTEFPGHYMISTFLTHLALRASGVSIGVDDVVNFLEDNVEKLGKDKVVGILIVLPIAFHHYHQVRGFASYTVDRDRVRSFIEEPKIYPRCVEDMATISKKTTSKRIPRLINDIQNILGDLGKYRNSDLYRGSKLFIEKFHDVIEKNVRLTAITASRVIVESIVGLINLCDGYVALRSRSRIVRYGCGN